jgi:hypothetical protein
VYAATGTTLALRLARQRPSGYLDLEAPADQSRLSDPVLYLSSQADKLVVLDEVQHLPERFPLLEGPEAIGAAELDRELRNR